MRLCPLPSGGRPLSEALPNKRLKLAGAIVVKETVMSCPGGHRLSSTTLAPMGESPAA